MQFSQKHYASLAATPYKLGTIQLDATKFGNILLPVAFTMHWACSNRHAIHPDRNNICTSYRHTVEPQDNSTVLAEAGTTSRFP